MRADGPARFLRDLVRWAPRNFVIGVAFPQSILLRADQVIETE